MKLKLALAISLSLHLLFLISMDSFYAVSLIPASDGENLKIKEISPESTEVSLLDLEDGEEITQAQHERIVEDCSLYYSGIGLNFTPDKIVESVPRYYPAARAGLKKGDLLIGEIQDLKGPMGTFAEFSVLRNNSRVSFKIKREKICLFN